MASSADPLRQRLPAQDMARLTLVAATPKAVADWVTQLPMVNVGESARQVYQTTQEINRLMVDDATRFQLLEAVRPMVHYLCQALAKHYLNQSVVLSEKATKVAMLAQAMQNHLAAGYRLIVVNLVDRVTDTGRRDAESLRLLGQAVHRAISDITGTLLRSAQLYLHTPARLWQELHALYLIATQQQLLDLKVKESSPRYQELTSIEEAYLRALLLATCKPNKLRQHEIGQVYDLSELWAGMVELKSLVDGDALFVFDLTKDAPPTYRTMAQGNAGEQFRAIDPRQLVQRLAALEQDPNLGNPRAKGELALSTALLHHLISAWSELSERSFQRVPHDGQLELCLGLTATHYFLADLVDFDTMIRGNIKPVTGDDNLFLRDQQPQRVREDERGKADVWSAVYSAAPAMTNTGDIKFSFGSLEEARAQAAQQSAQPVYDRYYCQIVNISPGGFCIEWSGNMPSTVKAGELVGVREDGQEAWSLGVIRWVHQIPGHGAQLGLEVLAPTATPCGARVIKKSGDTTEFMRTLLLPEVAAMGRRATLVTPNLTFKAGYRVSLRLEYGEEKVMLTKLVSTTQSFCQFEFQFMKRPPDFAASEFGKSVSRDDDFDSIWSSL